MRIVPGQPIPFWYRTGDRKTVNYVVARLTDQEGVEVSGSPFSLSVNSSGTWTGTGPVMGVNRHMTYYEVYKDAGLTLLNRSYLDVGEWIEPDMTASSTTVVIVSTPIKAKVGTKPILGKLMPIPEATGLIRNAKLRGTVTALKLTGNVILPNIEG